MYRRISSTSSRSGVLEGMALVELQIGRSRLKANLTAFPGLPIFLRPIAILGSCPMRNFKTRVERLTPRTSALGELVCFRAGHFLRRHGRRYENAPIFCSCQVRYRPSPTSPPVSAERMFMQPVVVCDTESLLPSIPQSVRTYTPYSSQ
jgi:hypothetical protein